MPEPTVTVELTARELEIAKGALDFTATFTASVLEGVSNPTARICVVEFIGDLTALQAKLSFTGFSSSPGVEPTAQQTSIPPEFFRVE